MHVYFRKLARDLPRVSLLSAFGMTVVLILASIVPSAGQTYANQSHYVVHVAAFAVFAAAWTWGLPRTPSFIVTLAVCAFASVHEAIEIVGHSHGYEMRDVLVDVVGAISGVWLARGLVIWCHR
jgi:hypothetical protein